MTATTKPDKQRVRDWMDRQHDDLPEMDEIREQLGWRLLDAEREARDERERSE